MSHIILKKLFRLVFPCFLLICCLSFFACSNESANEVSQGTPSTIPCKHEYKIVSTISATCVSEGSNTFECENCGHSYTEPISSTGHQFGDWHVLAEPTCAKLGEKERSCDLCEEKEITTIAQTSHKWNEATCKTPKTCAICGHSSGQTAAHMFSDGTCSICGETDPRYIEIADALKDIEGCFRYIEVNKKLIRLYNEAASTASSSSLLDYYNKTAEIVNDFYKNISKAYTTMSKLTYVDGIEEVKNYAALKFFISDMKSTNNGAPKAGTSMRSYISSAVFYADRVDFLWIQYQDLCKIYGVEIYIPSVE
jgi:hypothetical protein